MIAFIRRFISLLLLIALAGVPMARAQRQMENLGRGVVAMRTSSTQVYIGWRMLGDDPSAVGFNLYRSLAGAAATKLNGSTPITSSTNYVDTPGSTALTGAISYYVVPVLNGVEQAAGASYTLPANTSSGQQFINLPFATAYPNPASTFAYTVKFCWVGDFDGDGEYDFLVDRLSTNPTTEKQFLEAYKRDGTFLWRMDMGVNSVYQYAYEPGASAISVGDTDNVTVYDLDGDGKAEVAVRTANGVSVTNAAGQVVATISAASDTTQFVSIINGLTGAELARTTLPNPWAQFGTLTSKCAIGYFDGQRPSVLFYGYNRDGSGPFYRAFSAFDYRNGQLTQRWSTAQTFHGSEGHQIRIADVDNDGKDEVIDIGHVIDDNGTQLFDVPEITHGDRFHVADIDPDRPGLENFIIQQNNPSFLATAYYEAGTGQMIKKWYATDVVDVGRGIALDLNSTHKGYEMYSTQPGIYNAKGAQIYTNNAWAPEGLWWDTDLLREFIDGAGNGALNPAIQKFNQTTGVSDRVWSIYSDFGAYSITQAYGGRPAFWGDILGDWREELVFVKTDYTGMRLYTTTNVATNRLYTLMHNPAYRCQTTTKGYVQSSNVDYYLGVGMTTPPPPPMVPATLAWNGGASGYTWDDNTTASWKNTSSSAASAFTSGSSVRFDIAGNNASSIALSGMLQPGGVTVYSPNDFTFNGADGSLTGAMSLVKAGKGSLRLTGNQPYTGATTVWDGALRVDGTLSGSAVTVWGGTWGGALAKGLTGGRLSGSGTVAQAVSLQYRGTLTPGSGMNSAGTLSLGGGLTALDGSTIAFDLSNDPTGVLTANDLLAITGNLTLSGSVSIVINPTSGQLAAGAYTLATYTGTLSGSASNLSVVLPEGTPYSVALAAGKLTLTLPVSRTPGTVTWTGASSGAWDLANTPNWRISSAADVFMAGDSVLFNDIGSARPTVTLGVAATVAGVAFSGSTNYTLGGTGALSGSGGLTKSGNATVTLNTTNTFTGPVSLSGGVLAVDNLNDGGLPSSIGASSASASNFTINGATLRLIGAQTNTNRALTAGASGATIDIPTASVSMQISGAVSGSGSLTKSGAGTLILATANTHSGGTFLQAGTLVLASDTSNTSGLGSGGITLQGGILRMYDNILTYNTSAWPMSVPAGASARFETDGRCFLTGNLTGSGTLDFNTPYVRTELNGNWSAFTGTINVTTDADGGELRINNAYGYANATVNLATLVSAYALNGSTSIGALSGEAGSTLKGTAWTLGAKNTDTTFAGAITGNSVTKVGTGALTLTGNSTYTGATTVSAGKLILDGGSLSGSAITVQAAGAFGGQGSVTGTVNFTSGSTLLADPASGPLALTGNLTFGGTVTVAPVPGASLAAGTYPLYTYSGTLTGTPAFTWNGAGYTATFNTSVAGSVYFTLAVNTSRSTAAATTWTGAASSTWNAASVNWSYSGVATNFIDGDAVRFDDTSAVNSLTLSGTLLPSSVTVAATKNYTFSGSGAIGGAATLVKSGSGTLTISTAQTYTGGTTISAGTLVLGNATALGNGTLTLSGGTLATGSFAPANSIALTADSRITGGNATGTHGIKAVSGTGTLTLDATTLFDLEGSLSSFTGTLVLTGTGSFRLHGSTGSASADFNLGNRTLSAVSGSALSLGSLTGIAGSTLGNNSANPSATATFTVGARGIDSVFAGSVVDGSASSFTALTKTGNGTLTLSGNSTHTGATTVSGGSLLITGSLGATAVSVSSNATLGGHGTLGGNLTLASGSTLALGVAPSATKGLTVSGTSTLNGAITVVPAALGGILQPGTYTLLAYSGSLAGSPVFTWNDTSGLGYAATFDTTTAGLVKITVATAITTPSAPANLAAIAGNTQVSLSWNTSSSASSYTVLRSTTNGSGYVSIASSLTSPAYTDNGRTNGTTYYYVVRAVNTAGSSANSSQASTSPIAAPAAPANFTATTGNAQVSLSWSSSATAVSYTILRSTTSGSGYVSVAAGLTSPAYTDTGLPNGTPCYYVVRAVNTAGTSANSAEASATPLTAPAAPVNLVATPGNTQIALTWSPSATAVSYSVLRSTSSGSGYVSVVSGLTSPAYTNTSLTNGTAYFYFVRAVNAGGTSANSSEASASPLPPPAAPANLVATAGDTQIALTWSPSATATSYAVLRSTASGSGYVSIASGLTSPAYSDSGLTNGTAYFYVVTATNLGGTSAHSSEASATPLPPPPAAPANLVATAGDTQIALTWSPSATATSYAVLRSTASGSGYVSIASGLTSPAYSDSGLTNGTAYFYVVTATNLGGTSAHSSEASATPVSPLSALQQWRLTYFGSSSASGNAADASDLDGDGLPNLLEYALGSPPDSSSPNARPVTDTAAGRLRLTFNRIADPGLTYTLQGSSDFVSWVDVWSSTGAANTPGSITVADTFDLSITPRRFLRLRVSTPSP